MQWAVTATFYSALHALSAYLLVQGIQVSSQVARNRVLSNPINGVPRDVHNAYRDLDEYSRDACYELWTFALQDVRDRLDRELATIATFTGM
jgi:hypothetical protein